MAVLSGFTPKTAENLQLDAGFFAKNQSITDTFDITTIADEDKLGATSGGGTFTCIPTIRNLFEDLDGAVGEYMEGLAVETWEVKMSTAMKEITAENIAMSIGPADVISGTGFDTITPRMEIKDEDFLENLCWFGTVNKRQKPIIIEIKNAMNSNGFNYTINNKGTGQSDVEIKGYFNLENPLEVPCKIWYPKN